MNCRHRGRSQRNTLSVLLASLLILGSALSAEDYYTGEQVFALRPKPEKTRELGHIGPTGIIAFVEKGVKVTVQETRKGSPADGKFTRGEIILSVNNQPLKGLNPFVVLGEAITKAEAGNGTMVFEVESKKGQRRVELKIPVLGAYGPNWPVDCQKSKKIIESAAAFYSKWLGETKDMGISGVLPCLFLLSTGDDTHLPVVQKHLQKFLDRKNSIGNNTWNNGYIGITFAEYYLRTGDKSVLPILQAICDFARDHQFYNSAWKHWGAQINPAYVGGGLMNPASVQVLTTLLLCKEVGVNVDEKTLHNALRYFYRFAGHGTVPYGDHRGEGGLGCNGKNAMAAVAMHIASGAAGDTSIYSSARDYLSMSTLTGYPDMVVGHADNGRGDGLWRGISSAFLREKSPELYRNTMNRITWWYDLCRADTGALGIATCPSWAQDIGSGAGPAMTYTAPLQKLRILGAPRSKFAKEFTLPTRLWGTEGDLAFHSIKPAANFESHGRPLPIYRMRALLGSGYSKGADPKSVPLEQLHRCVRHSRYVIRAEAAKTLCAREDFNVIEALLKDSDPRIRRAALDGIIDWRYFFGPGKKPLAAEKFTQGMIESISAMLSNPKESLYVTEGALFAVSYMPVEAIQKNIPLIMPWTKNDDWWLRHASFMALQGLSRNPDHYIKVLPALLDMMVAETHRPPREGMDRALIRFTLKKHGPDSEIGKMIIKGYEDGIRKGQILEGRRAREGKYNIKSSIESIASMAPSASPQLTTLLAERGLSQLDDDELLALMSGGRFFKGFIDLINKMKEGPERKQLQEVLEKEYRPELSKRLKAKGGKDLKFIDAVLGILHLRDPNLGWKPIGTPEFEKRTWQYISFDPTAEKDFRVKRDGRRYRDIEIPAEMKGWSEVAFDASKWKSGFAPIGKGKHPRGRKKVDYPSDWGEGEVLLARTTFELDSTDFDQVRLRVLCGNGFNVYLNGKMIKSYTWWHEQGQLQKWPLDAKHLRKGTNTIAIRAFSAFPSEIKPHWKEKVWGELNCYIEQLNKEDLY